MTTNWHLLDHSPPAPAVSPNGNFHYSCNYYAEASASCTTRLWRRIRSQQTLQNTFSEVGTRGESKMEASCQTEQVTNGAYEEGLGVALAEISSQNTTTAVAAWIATSSQQLISPTGAGSNLPSLTAGESKQADGLNRRDVMVRPLDLRSPAEIPNVIPVRAPPEVPPHNVQAGMQQVQGAGRYVGSFQPMYSNYSQVHHFPASHPPAGFYSYQQQKPCYYDNGGRCYECNNVYGSGPCPGPGGAQFFNYPPFPQMRHPYQGWSGENMRHYPVVPVPRYAAPDPRQYSYPTFYGPVEANQEWASSSNTNINSNIHRYNPEYYGSYTLPHPAPVSAHPQMFNQLHPQVAPPVHAEIIAQTPQKMHQTVPLANKSSYIYATSSVLKSPEHSRPSTLPVPVQAVSLEKTPQPIISSKQDQNLNKFSPNKTAQGSALDQTGSWKKEKKRFSIGDDLSADATQNISFNETTMADVTTVEAMPRSNINSNTTTMDEAPETGETSYEPHSELSSKMKKKNAGRKKKLIEKELVQTGFKTPIRPVTAGTSNKRKRPSDGDAVDGEQSSMLINSPIDVLGLSAKKIGSSTKKGKSSKVENVNPVSNDDTRKDKAKAAMLNKLRYRLRSAFGPSKPVSSEPVEKETKKSSESPSAVKTKGKVKKLKKPKASRSLGSTPNSKGVFSPPGRNRAHSPDIVSLSSLGSGNDSMDQTNDLVGVCDEGNAAACMSYCKEKEDEILIQMRSWTLNKAEGETVLHRAATLGLPEVVSYCMSRLIMLNPNCVNNRGYSPLHDACVHGHEKVVEALLTFRAGPSKKAPGGVRPLHLAAKHGHLEIVKLLVSRGADPSLKTDKGESVMDLAEESVKQFLSTFIMQPHAATAPDRSIADQPTQPIPTYNSDDEHNK